MNHVYRVVFNRALGVYQCVSEIAKSQGKSSARGTQNRRAGFVLSSLSMAILSTVAVGAQAMTYSNSQTIATDPYIIDNRTDVVTGTGVVVGAKDIIVGDTGVSTLQVENGGTLNISATPITFGRLTLGNQATGDGGVVVRGTNSTLNTGDLFVGNSGTGAATIAKGGTVKATGTTFLGFYSGSNGTLTVTGTDSMLNTQDLVVGRDGTGEATIERGGTVETTEAVLGFYSGSNGTLTVTGAGSTLNTRFLYVGVNGTGKATIAEGGTVKVTRGITYLGIQAGSNGTLTVTGAGSTLNTDRLFVGNYGTGAATIESGGKVETARSTNLGYFSGGNGTLTVTGAGSTLNTRFLEVGGNGTGEATIEKGGRVIASNVVRNTSSTSSTINFDGGTLTLKSDQADLFSNFNKDNTNNSISLPYSINLLSGGGTIDTNGNAVTVSNGAVIGGAGSFTKSGTGTLSMNTINNKAWTGDTTINQGTLTLIGDYSMAPGETLTIGLNDIEGGTALDTNGRLSVDGTIDISEGALQIDASSTLQSSSSATWNDIITATTRTGEFQQVTDDSPLVNFQAQYDNNTVDIRMVKVTTPPVITPPVTQPITPEPPVVAPPVTPKPPVINSSFVRAVTNQRQLNDLGIASALDSAIDDRISSGNNPLADALIRDTINFDEPKLAAAANDLQPLLTGATNRIITDSNYKASDAIHKHLPLNRGLWAKVIGSQSSQDSENGISGYDTDSYGAIVGLDMPMSNKLNLGLAVSYIDSDTDNYRDDMSAKSIQAFGYGIYNVTNDTRLDFHAGAGSSDIEGTRQLSILTKGRAQSDYSADTLQAGLGVTHRIGSTQRNISPFARVSYAQAKSDSYQETGAGDYNLNVNANTYESMRWIAGLNMSQALTPQIAITGKLAGGIENGDKQPDISARFVSGSDEFTTLAQEVGREMGIAGIGISYTPTKATTLSAGYTGEWRDNYEDQGASVALNVRF